MSKPVHDLPLPIDYTDLPDFKTFVAGEVSPTLSAYYKCKSATIISQVVIFVIVVGILVALAYLERRFGEVAPRAPGATVTR